MSTLAVLTLAEREALTRAEEKIQAGVGTFVQVGIALAEIRDSKLYREQFATFEEYCDVRFGLGREHAYQTINSARVASELPQFTMNAGQAAALAKVPKEKRAEVFEKVQSSGKVTAARITAAASSETQTATEPQPVVKNFSQTVQRDFKKLCADFADLLSEDIDVDVASMEEDARWLFLEVESRVIEKHPEMIPGIQKTIFKLGHKIAARTLAV